MDNVRSVYKNHWKYTKVLPRIIQTDLLREWLNGDYVIQDTQSNRISVSEWSSLMPMNVQTFVDLMSLPYELPSFAVEDNNIIFEYFEWKEGSKITKLCPYCYGIKSKFYRNYSENYWKYMNWRFYKIEEHLQVHINDILEELIWDLTNWCELCVMEPLFDIIDGFQCNMDFAYHCKRRNLYDSDSDTSDDSYDKRVSRITGNSICDFLFKDILRNRYFSW